MNSQLRSATVYAALGLSLLLCPRVPANAQNSASVNKTMETTATIETTDAKTRQVLLKGQDGTYITMVAGPEVRNFAQIKPGDRVFTHYEGALVARIGTPGHTMLSDADVIEGESAARGEKPGGARYLEMRRKIKITAIDLDRNTVSFIGPANIPRVVQVRSPQMQAFLRTLKVGDYVDVSYREAAMIDVQPAH